MMNVNDIKDEQQENRLTVTKPQNHFAHIFSESAYGYGSDAVVKDEDMDVGCSERQFDKRVPRAAISISIYIASN
ncbi:uncharacterized protein FPRO_00186 [Fusarium proliferatum ET1]|uniref:Uncharacterized protein n=1 Tax=Fusarium proliferatum (strain ET1) TaxID=1227346 RepID=A0A1L7V476_FUSPR|nr:uncharacterized protein FPRO_00186 [Fusarium proliferatum ET1]CZR35691.1 uncharacterized protein FPRO_00186 [Fusarium proliferatum ET1]